MGWRSYFRFSRQERWAVAGLVTLTLLAWTLPYMWVEHTSPPAMRPWPAEDIHPAGAASAPGPSGAKERLAPVVHKPFAFDPNTLDEKGWLALGLSQGKVGTLLKYRSRGGRFRKPEDLTRVYSLSSDDVARLLPYVRIRETATRPGAMDSSEGRRVLRQDPMNRPEPPRRVRLEVNSADSQAWVRLPGIGPGWASRILRFRRRLGGFLSVGQVAETYGLPDSVFQSVRPLLYVDSSRVQPWVDINGSTVEQLAAHPYVSFRVAKAIIAYREVHGPFSRVEDLGRLALVPPDLLERIRPYVRL